MTQTTVTDPTATLPAGIPVLPGRTVDVEFLDIDANRPYFTRGIVIDVTTDGECTVMFADGSIVSEAGAALRPVTPDRPTLAYDGLAAATLGEKIAERHGQLEGFHRGHNDGRATYTEIARSMLAEIDARAFTAKHSRCTYRFVETPAGERRESRIDYVQGDRLVECSFYVDGPGTFYCGVHRPMVEADGRGCIFHAGVTEGEREASRERGELVHRAPLVRAGVEAEPAELVLTEVEVKQVELDHLVDVVRAVLVVELQRDRPAREAAPGLAGRELYAALVTYLTERSEPAPGSVYWEALAYGVRRGLLVFHTGPRYSPAPDYRAHEAEVPE